MQARKTEELLESIFTAREEGVDSVDGILARTADAHAPDKCAADFDALAAAGLVRRDGVRVLLTDEGEARARGVVRRHRLTERLFHDILAVSDEDAESPACDLEHTLSVEATDSVCALLGHPPTCPHGKPIPPGACCGTYVKTVTPLVTRLPHLELGATARVVFVAPRWHDRMDRLAALGVTPGVELRLHQRAPAFVVEIAETTLALDPEIAGEIYVRRVG